jgi:CheY-like chemotaxis protein
MPKILLVDDEPEILYLVRLMLEHEGYEVIEAKNGDECLKKLRSTAPDLILLDIMMPGLDGWEICRRIKADKETKNIPVVMLTVRTSEDSIKKSFEYAGCDAHLNKPFDRRHLLDIIGKLLGKNK